VIGYPFGAGLLREVGDSIHFSCPFLMRENSYHLILRVGERPVSSLVRRQLYYWG